MVGLIVDSVVGGVVDVDVDDGGGDDSGAR